jgi:hypothetical protein
MMRLALLILLLGIAAGASADEARVYVGELRAISRESLQLSRNESLISIGFVGDPAALAELDGLRVGEQVRVVFGSAPRPGGSGRINKLLSIRRCSKSDAQCAADGIAQDANDAEAAKARALSEQKMAQCDRQMKRTLLSDNRFAPETIKMSETQSEEVLREFNLLSGQRQECAAAVIRNHQSAVLEACELHHCGNGIGGGCSHIAGYSLSEAVFARALVDCKAK